MVKIDQNILRLCDRCGSEDVVKAQDIKYVEVYCDQCWDESKDSWKMLNLQLRAHGADKDPKLKSTSSTNLIVVIEPRYRTP